MENIEEFISSIDTLLHSWGSDTPQEVIWGLNEMVDWLEHEYNVTISTRFSDPYANDAIDPDVVLDEIRSKL
jgi:hypothetical protein